MNKFLSGSILLHVLVILVLGQNGFFVHALDGRKTSLDGSRLVFVMIAASNGGESMPLLEKSIDVNGGGLAVRDTEAYKGLASAGAGATKKNSFSGNGAGEKIVLNDKEKNLQDADLAHNYFIAGRLTRLPVPLMPLDLNVPPITSRAPTRPIEITLFIDATGVVSDIVSSDDDEINKEFFELVALQLETHDFRRERSMAERSIPE